MKDKLHKFMMGRYGADNLSRFLLILSFLLLIFSLIFRKNIFSLLALALLIWNYTRMLSRNCNKRYQENGKYLQLKYQLQNYAVKNKSASRQKKTHHIYHCPKCRQKVRVPKGKGKICITCPSCKKEFFKKS